jgi:predicted ATPase
VTQPVEALALPAMAQGVLLARIDRLHDELKAVLQVAAVMGRVFSVPVLLQVVPGDVALEQILGELTDLEFVYPTSLTPQREYSFKHVLTQEAVYNTLLRAGREVYHERIGTAMETLYADRLDEFYEVLTYHYTRSANTDKAVQYLDLAHQKATRASAMEVAYAYFTEAMQLLDTLPTIEVNHQRRISLLFNPLQGAIPRSLLRT